MDHKIFFFDIDGTLTDDRNHKIVPSAKEAICLLQKAGHFVALATGRFHYKTVSVAKELGIKHFVCSGGACLVLNDQIIKNEVLDLTKVTTYLKNAEKNNLGYLLLREDNDSVDMKDFKFLEQAGLRKELTTYHYRPDLDVYALKDIYKIYLALKKEDENKYPWLKLLGHLRMTDNYIVVQHDKKDEGIRELLQIINAQAKQVVVFGDGDNDQVMFQKQYFKVAMANGSKSLQKMADYVCEKSYEDGIYKTCLKFNWFKKEK